MRVCVRLISGECVRLISGEDDYEVAKKRALDDRRHVRVCRHIVGPHCAERSVRAGGTGGANGTGGASGSDGKHWTGGASGAGGASGSDGKHWTGGASGAGGTGGANRT